MPEQNIERILIDEPDIAERVAELGYMLTKKYEGKTPFFICPLKGSMIFLADLLRQVRLSCEVDFMAVSSYNSNTFSSGNVKVNKDLGCDIKGKNVIIVEDIVDTGNTIYELKNMLEMREPESLEICALLDKPARRIKPVYPDYCGFSIPDLFVVGYGMDLDEKYRNLPYIGVYRETMLTT